MATQQTRPGEETRTSESRDPQQRASQPDRGQGQAAIQRRQQRGGGLTPFGLGPFGLIRRMQEDLDRMFGAASLGFGGLGPSTEMSAPMQAPAHVMDWTPPVETFQRGSEFVIRADVPGVAVDDLMAEVGEDVVTIRGERRQEREEERHGVYVAEVTYGSFERTIPLPPGAIADNATAEFRDGVLEIVVPAPSQEARRGRRLEIQGSRESASRGGARSEGQQNREQRR